MKVTIFWADGHTEVVSGCTTVCPPGVACEAWTIFKRTGQRYIRPDLIASVETEFSETEQETAALYQGKERG